MWRDTRPARFSSSVDLFSFGDFVSLDTGLHPSGRLRLSFFVPTPPGEQNLTLFASAAKFPSSSTAPLAPWLELFANEQLNSAAAAGRALHEWHSRRNEAEGLPARTPCPSPVVSLAAAADGRSFEPDADVESFEQVVGDDPRAPPTATPVPVLGGQASAGAARAARGPDQLVCRGLKSVEQVLLAWDTGLNGYGPMKDYKNDAGGKLDLAQVNLLSKAHMAWKKVQDMGREDFRRKYEVPVEGKVPTLASIRDTIERENRLSKRGNKRARQD